MRTHYKNGDDIALTHNGCDGCTPVMINGVLVHERGCPDAWRDEERECRWCGEMFYPRDEEQTCCSEDCGELGW